MSPSAEPATSAKARAGRAAPPGAPVAAPSLVRKLWNRFLALVGSSEDAAVTTTILLAFLVGIAGGLGSLVFAWWIKWVRDNTLEAVPPVFQLIVPAVGLLVVAWMTRRFAPEAQGHGVPEVIAAVARQGGVIRARVAAIKTLASGLTIGTGGSVGREGPIVQIGSGTGSLFGQYLRLPERNVKVLVAAGAAAGISATFFAPLAGVMFAAEIILGNFAVSSLTPIVIAAVIANLVAQNGMWLVEPSRVVDDRVLPVFEAARDFKFDAIGELPIYLLLGLVAGVVAVGFTKFLYATEDVFLRRIHQWYNRAILGGLIVGLLGTGLLGLLPGLQDANGAGYLFGVGYEAVSDALAVKTLADVLIPLKYLLLLLAFKFLTTSSSLAGGGSGGIFAPSLFLGAMLGGVFGLAADALFPGLNLQPGAFSVVGMAAFVAGTTHAPMSAVLILFEMTHDYNMILPLMCAAGLSSVISRTIDPESIYLKKLSRRGQLTAWGHHTTPLEDVYVRDLMVTNFPTVPEAATLADIVAIATRHPELENLPVMNAEGKLLGVIRAEDLHRLLDSDMQPHLVRALDIVQRTPTRLTPDDNLLGALREFGDREDVESLPVMIHAEGTSRLIGLLPRADVMRRYRQEMLRQHTGNKQ